VLLSVDVVLLRVDVVLLSVDMVGLRLSVPHATLGISAVETLTEI
jgi:hypothetical protein